MRGVTFPPYARCRRLQFLLTRLMRGVTGEVITDLEALRISTHTPHARRDENHHSLAKTYKISTHTPHARRDRL